MDVKEAVALAKGYIRDLFSGEAISNVGLEEVEFVEGAKVWRVTIGFSRPWDTAPNALAAIAQQVSSPKRSYKVVQIDDSRGQVRSVKNREIKS